jgi:hypothetical protein
MRKATTQYGNPVTVLSWRQLPNGWEVWQLEDADPDGIFYSYAEGDELDGLDPPIGWEWDSCKIFN